MTRGFTFGKYYPFHKGHEALINFALKRCNELIVVVCVSNTEAIDGLTRAAWIEDSFPSTPKLKVIVFEYDESSLPNTSVSSEEVSELWSAMFLELLPPVDCVFTSEKYGDYVAHFMNIKHVPFDYQRVEFPISSSSIRSQLDINWNYLTPSVKRSMMKKVVVLGTESTGKSTLCALLAKHYQCDFVPEMARELDIHSTECTMEGLYTIAEEHSKAIEAAASISKSSLLIIDTNVDITISYARFLFQEELVLSEEIVQSNKADLYLYLGADCPFVQDGTRLNEKDRNDLHLSHLRCLEEKNIDFQQINGDWENRFSAAVAIIDVLLISN